MSVPPAAETPSSDTLILAASDRLARALREDYSLARRREGAQVWEAPAVQSLRQWLQDAWTASWPAEQLLHSAQELALWQQVIERDEAGSQLLAQRSAAREARRADQLLLRHAMDLSRWRLQSDDHRIFARWHRSLRSRLRQRGWLTAADLPAAVAAGLAQGRIAAPPRVRLAGFVDEPAAAERRLFEALAAAGSQIEFQAAPAQASAPRRLRYADAESQFRCIAAQLRARLAPYAGHAEPPPRLVLALPDPEARRDLIESLLRPLLAPWLQRLDGTRMLPWRWDAGMPLEEQPQVAAALAVSELAREGNEPGLISRVLLAAPLWSEDERLLAARADASLRDEGWPRLSLYRVQAALPAPLQPLFARLERVIAAAPARALPSAWAAHFRERLAVLGWPGRVPAASAGFQAQREWERLLARLSSMDAQLRTVGAGAVLSWLRELARSARFEARVEYGQPLLIVGIEEAAALPCDGLYLADLAADRFPPRAAPSAYLPLELQMAAGVPGADPARSLERARRLAAHLAGLAGEVQLSYAQIDERGADVHATPLFGAGEWTAAEPPRRVSGLDRRVAAGPACRLPASDPVPAVDAQEHAQLRPNLSLFRAWQASPFFAFCQVRLGVEVLRRPAHGLDARRQGNVVHAVLQSVWKQLEHSRGLAAALQAGSLEPRVAAALDPALERHMPQADYGRAQVELERARLADVLAQWLHHESRRADPFAVAFTEQETSARIGSLQLRLRVDRIDRVELFADDARWLVIDYKSGPRADPKDWDAARLVEPQLPLYASCATLEVPQVDGIAFGHLKDGHPALPDATNWRDGLVDGPPVDRRDAWQLRQQAWRDVLEAAAEGFVRGEAGVDPKVSDRSYYAELLLLVGREADDSEPAGAVP